jgi:CheY-like chemotaxis protein
MIAVRGRLQASMRSGGCAAPAVMRLGWEERQTMAIEAAKKVLVAEDNPALSGVVRFNLQRAGFDVAVARNGREAFQAACQTAFDVVLTDQQMPEMTGTELCVKLRRRQEYSETPIIMLTAKGLELDLDYLREELGVSAALPKPFSPTELISLVEECLAGAVAC